MFPNELIAGETVLCMEIVRPVSPVVHEKGCKNNRLIKALVGERTVIVMMIMISGS